MKPEEPEGSNRSRPLRAAVRDTLLKFGWDVQRTASLQATKRAAHHQQELAKWRILATYAPDVVLDIGANTGQFAALVRELLPRTRIISFEPLGDCYAELCRQETRLAPWSGRPYALGDADGSMAIQRNDYTPSSSLLPMGQLHKDELPHTAKTVTEIIQVRRLDGLAQELRLDGSYFAKIDVQGYTMPVLRGGERVLRGARAIVAEVSLQPLYHGEATFAEAYALLTSWGFIYRGNVDQWISPRDGRILQADCLFEHPAFAESTRPEDVSYVSR